MTFSHKVKREIHDKYFTYKMPHSKIAREKPGSFDKDALRELFMDAGTISDPEKSYHLELRLNSVDEAGRVLTALGRYGIAGGMTKRGRHTAVYVKDSDSIAAFLAAVGAHAALLDFENARALREMREGVQRRVNCETANISKTVAASMRQIDDIHLIDSAIGISSLPEALAKTARLRLKYPDASYKELAARMPGTGRSGINHRLRRLSEIAIDLRDQERGIHDNS